MKASRRMWSRRILRAGWLIAPIFSFPGRLWTGIKKAGRVFFYSGSKPDWSFIFFMTCVGGFIAWFTWMMVEQSNKYTKHATPTEIKEAAKDQCVATQLARRLEIGLPIREYDISYESNRCDGLRVVEQQKQLLK